VRRIFKYCFLAACINLAMCCGGLLVRSTLFARPDSVTIAYPHLRGRIYTLATDRGVLHFRILTAGFIVSNPYGDSPMGPDIVSHFSPDLHVKTPLLSPAMPSFLYSSHPGSLEPTTAGFALVSRWRFFSLTNFVSHTWTIAVPLWLPMLLFLYPPLRWLRRRLRGMRNRRGFEPLPAVPLHAAIQVNK
jgi:hypothetical protein